MLLALNSCKQNPAPKEAFTLTDTLTRIDTTNVAATYNKVAKAGVAAMDTFYNTLATSLMQQDKYALLHEHLNYYTRDQKDNLAARALVIRVNAFTYNFNAMYDSARSYFTQAIKLDQALNNKPGLAQSYLGMGINEVYFGNFEKSLEYHYLSLHLYEQLKDSAHINRVQIEIAIDYYYQKEYNKAIALLLSCEAYYKRQEDLHTVAEVYSILSSCFYNLNDFSRSADYARSSLDIRRKLGSAKDIAESLNNLSLPLMEQGQWNEASEYLKESLILMKQAGDKRQLPIISQNLASCLWENGDIPQAETILKDVIAEAKQTGQKDAVANAYKKLSDLNKRQGNADSALYYFKFHKRWSDSLYNDEKIKTISTLNVAYETAKKEQIIQQLEAKSRLEQTKKTLYLLLSIFIAIAAISAVLLLISRNRANKLLIEKVSLELAASEKELLLNKKELHTFTNRLLAKNKSIEELERKLHQSTEKNPSIDSSLQDKQISALFQLKILTEDDWTEFKMRFDKVYPGYINKLRAQYPELAPGDQRQFLLIKLNIETKECANMLGISIDSIKKNRYRLKKKFNLSEKESLDEFVRNFSI